MSSSVLDWLRLTECLPLGWWLSLTGWLVSPQSPLVRGQLTLLTSNTSRLSCYHCPDLVTRWRPHSSTSSSHLPAPSSEASLSRRRSRPGSGSSVKSHMEARSWSWSSHVRRWRSEARRRLWRSHSWSWTSTSHARGTPRGEQPRRTPEAEGSSHAGRWWTSQTKRRRARHPHEGSASHARKESWSGRSESSSVSSSPSRYLQSGRLYKTSLSIMIM